MKRASTLMPPLKRTLEARPYFGTAITQGVPLWQRVAMRCGLTPAETRLVAALADGESLKDIGAPLRHHPMR
jgi:hypothetical protein